MLAEPGAAAYGPLRGREWPGGRVSEWARDPSGCATARPARVLLVRRDSRRRRRAAELPARPDASCCRVPVSAPPRGPSLRRDAIRRTRTPPGARGLLSDCGHPRPRRRRVTGRCDEPHGSGGDSRCSISQAGARGEQRAAAVPRMWSGPHALNPPSGRGEQSTLRGGCVRGAGRGRARPRPGQQATIR